MKRLSSLMVLGLVLGVPALAFAASKAGLLPCCPFCG